MDLKSIVKVLIGVGSISLLVAEAVKRIDSALSSLDNEEPNPKKTEEKEKEEVLKNENVGKLVIDPKFVKRSIKIKKAE
jgi:hypothetical protein